MVPLSEVLVVANRATEAPFSATMRRQFLRLISLIEGWLDPALVERLTQTLEPNFSAGRRDEASRVLREFVTAAMGTSSMQQEFTPAGVQMLADLEPAIVVDEDTPFGRLAEGLGLLVHSSRRSSGFDSAATAILSILGCATVGQLVDHPDADVGRHFAKAAEEVWGEEWVDRLFDAAFHVEELSPAPLTRYTASLTYLGTNRYLRQAQSSGVSISYARNPGLALPESYFGEAVLADRLRGINSQPEWSFSPELAQLALRTSQQNEGNPFRIFNFERGLLDLHIHGIRRYCLSSEDSAGALSARLAKLAPSQRAAYVECAVSNLSHTLMMPFIEIALVNNLRDFDWWKDHIIRSSPREILLGLRNARARRVAHALLVQTTMLPDVVESAETDSSLRDRLRIYVKNLEFGIIDERYHDDLRRGLVRVVKSAAETLSEADARNRAEVEVRRLLAAAPS
jgi:hypothetical protein